MLTDKQQQVVNFDKTLFEYSLKNKTFLPVVFVIKLQFSKISVNMSKGHTYFEEFTLWILIKKSLNFEYSLKKKPFCSSLPDQLSRFMPNTFLLAHFWHLLIQYMLYRHFIPMDIFWFIIFVWTFQYYGQFATWFFYT